jgi:hypothetical protein
MPENFWPEAALPDPRDVLGINGMVPPQEALSLYDNVSLLDPVWANYASNLSRAPLISIADGATVEIHGVSDQSVSFEGITGELKLDDAVAFTGQISGLAGSDALDLADMNFGPATTATFLGNTAGGTLTVTDGTHAANVSVVHLGPLE